MTNEHSHGARLSDGELLLELRRLTGNERDATAQLIGVLGEVDVRRLYLVEGCSSLFTYCTQVLHLSEHAAYGRIEAARAARKWPVILELLADGSLHLTAIGLLAAQLTLENHQHVLAAARHRTKREVEEIVAALRPQPPVQSSVRKLPTPRHGVGTLGVPSQAPVSIRREDGEPALVPRTPENRAAAVRPLAPEQYKVQFTVSRETYGKLRQAQDLLRHRVPNGDVAVIFDRALTLLLSELHKTRHAEVTRPRAARPHRAPRRRPSGRHIPAAVKREVWTRDGAQCAFVGENRRCTERGFLEYHHVVPFADGGATTAGNLELRCRAHNAYEAERWFGVPEADLVREAPMRFRAHT